MTFDDLISMMKTMTKDEVVAKISELPEKERKNLVIEVCRKTMSMANYATAALCDIAVENNTVVAEESRREMLQLMQRLTTK